MTQRQTSKSNIPGPATGVRPAPSQGSGTQTGQTQTAPVRFTDWASI
jgi:hypothetical protein